MINFYQDNGNMWRWRVVADNGKVVGASSQGFATRAYAKKNLALLNEMYRKWDWK